MKKINVLNFEFDEVEKMLINTGEKPFRTKQIFSWLYKKKKQSFYEMHNISKDLRSKLERVFFIPELNVETIIKSQDKSIKYVFQTEDDKHIESVLLLENERFTLCLSTQIGCPLECVFCLTGKLGFIRNLQVHEIINQILTIERDLGEKKRISNIVIMGMGEPLLNYKNMIKALKIIVSPYALNYSHRRVSLSTAGIIPPLISLSREGLDINLAISLNAADGNKRTRLMPINKKFPVKSLIEACRRLKIRPRQRLTFEYILMEGINDSVKDAMELVRLLKGIKCKINLIPFNPWNGTTIKPSSEDTILSFQKILIDNNYTALIRQSRGRDIGAACGQLGGTVK